MIRNRARTAVRVPKIWFGGLLCISRRWPSQGKSDQGTYLWGSAQFRHDTKINNSIKLKWVMFDIKNVIYIKFWVYYKGAKIFGGLILPTDFQICPPKINVSFFLKARRNVWISQPIGRYFKEPYARFSSAPELEDQLISLRLVLILISAAPQSFG